MERVVLTVEALRCHQCQKPIHPTQEPFFRRQMLTAVETGLRIGTVHRHEMVTVCAQCQAFLEHVAAEDRKKDWWGRFWWTAVIAAFMGSLFTPYAMATLYAAIIVRVMWKWQAKRRGKRALGLADQREVPQAAVPSDASSGLTKDGSA